MHTKIFVAKLEGKNLLGRNRRRWKDNIKSILGQTGWEGVDLVYLTRYTDQWWALMAMVMNLQVPYESGNLLTS
jgi:hypothetical protein